MASDGKAKTLRRSGNFEGMDSKGQAIEEKLFESSRTRLGSIQTLDTLAEVFKRATAGCSIRAGFWREMGI